MSLRESVPIRTHEFCLMRGDRSIEDLRKPGIMAVPLSHITVKRFRPLLATMFLVLSCSAESSPVEAGKVDWGRDLDTALNQSRQSGNPVFALFQEIPGCAGCRQFGQEVLSNPLLVEAIETEFIPLLIHNNKPGKDAEVLRKFGEPAWNYQVVRFLDADEKDIIPRRDQVWDTSGIAERMITTLEKAGRPVPTFLRLIEAEHSSRLQEAAFSMFCFWTGEVRLGQMDGVVSTQAGFRDGAETVFVRYDPKAISLPELIAEANRSECRHMEASSDLRSAPASDQKKQIQGTRVEGLEMSTAQATKVNAWIRVDKNKALGFLTPSQRSRLK